MTKPTGKHWEPEPAPIILSQPVRKFAVNPSGSQNREWYWAFVQYCT